MSLLSPPLRNVSGSLLKWVTNATLLTHVLYFCVKKVTVVIHSRQCLCTWRKYFPTVIYVDVFQAFGAIEQLLLSSW